MLQPSFYTLYDSCLPNRKCFPIWKQTPLKGTSNDYRKCGLTKQGVMYHYCKQKFFCMEKYWETPTGVSNDMHSLSIFMLQTYAEISNIAWGVYWDDASWMPDKKTKKEPALASEKETWVKVSHKVICNICHGDIGAYCI